MIQRAYINPEMMRWAREYAGFIGQYQKDLPEEVMADMESWESGEKVPTWDRLYEVSKIFNVPTAFFFMKSPLDSEFLPDLIDFRQDDNSIRNHYSPDLISDIRRFQNMREIYICLSRNLHEEIPSFHIPDLEHDEASFIRHFRKTLGKLRKTCPDQNPNCFLNHCKETLNQELGLLVFETENVDVGQMRGLCILHGKAPLILLNGKPDACDRILTLFHELAHLFLGQSAICGEGIAGKEEVFCNSVAEGFLASVGGLPDSHSNQSDEDCLNGMIRYNGKPYYSILLKAYDSGIISSLELSRYGCSSKRNIPLLCGRLD